MALAITVSPNTSPKAARLRLQVMGWTFIWLRPRGIEPPSGFGASTEKMLDSTVKSRTCGRFLEGARGAKSAQKGPQILKNRTGSGRQRRDLETHHPEVEGSNPFPRNQRFQTNIPTKEIAGCKRDSAPPVALFSRVGLGPVSKPLCPVRHHSFNLIVLFQIRDWQHRPAHADSLCSGAFCKRSMSNIARTADSTQILASGSLDTAGVRITALPATLSVVTKQ
ncbi:MAG: hypothetical protein ACLQU2_30310 [Candidatus Binataceae bacterium]